MVIVTSSGTVSPSSRKDNNRVRWILGEAVFALSPLVDELPGTQVAYDPLGTISKEESRSVPAREMSR